MTDDAERQSIALEFIRDAERRYSETDNPVFVWEAIAECSAACLPFPQFVAEYLARVSTQIAQLSRSDLPREGQITKRLAMALEFRKRRTGDGATNLFARIGDDTHEMMIAFDVRTQLGRGDTKELGAFTCVSERHPARCTHDPQCAHISVSTVRAIWKKLAHRFPGHPNYFATRGQGDLSPGVAALIRPYRQSPPRFKKPSR